MQKYLFEEKKEILIPKTANFRPPLDSDGRPLSGDSLIKMYGSIITDYEKKHNRPVPIEDQKFIGWVKQFCSKLDAGESSDAIFRATVV